MPRTNTIGAAIGIGALLALSLSGCPTPSGRSCSSNVDCRSGELCVLSDGRGTCGVADPNPERDAGSDDADGGERVDGGEDVTDGGAPNPDAGPSDAGPRAFALGFDGISVGETHARSVGAGDDVRLRARAHVLEPSQPVTGGTITLSPPRH
jgi:hypothetical protein